MSEDKQDSKLVPELRFPEFEKDGEWEIVQLGNKTTKVGSGKTPRGGDKNYKTHGRPFIRSQNIGWGRLLIDDIAYIDEEVHETFLGTEIKENDVLLNITGASIGRSAIANNAIVGGNVNQHVCIIRTKQQELNPIFLNQFLISNNCQNQIDSFQAGGNREGLNFGQIRSFAIPIPPKPNEQKKIANTLTSLDNWIGAENEKLEALKAHKKGLLQQLFPAKGERVPVLRFWEFEGDGDWEIRSIEKNIDLISGIALKSKELTDDKSGTPILRGINITEGQIRHSQEMDKFYLGDPSKIDRYLVEEKDIVIGMDGSKVGKNVALISKQDAGSILIQRVARIRAVDSDVEYLYQHFVSYGFRNYVDMVNTSSGIPHISAKQIRDYEIGFPPKIKEQQKIADCLSSLDDLIAAQLEKIEGLQAHKKGLMQQMFPNINTQK